MKKTKRFVSFALALAMMFTVSSFAFAEGNIIKAGTKSTPYGTLTGNILQTGTVNEWIWYGAETSINSNYSMALTYVKMDAIDNDTGALIQSDSDARYDKNYAFCDVDVDRTVYQDVTLYTTHEVTYTTSYVLYMYHHVG